jgi:hypothetical protein
MILRAIQPKNKQAENSKTYKEKFIPTIYTLKLLMQLIKLTPTTYYYRDESHYKRR